MKRKFGLIVSALALIVVMVATLAACGSTWGKIKKAYEKENYHEVEMSEDLKKTLHLDEMPKTEVKMTIHVMTTAELPEKPSALDYAKLLTAKYAVILEFTSTSDVKKYAEEHYTEEQKKDMEKAWEEFQKLDSVNGNCVLVMGDGAIFKGTK